MFLLYTFLIIVVEQLLRFIAFFNPKMRLFVEGRRMTFSILKEKIDLNDKTIWFHAASLGEFEQGLPVIEKIKDYFPFHKIVVTFFSPSGYEVRRNSTAADVICYLPMDTIHNAKKWVEFIHPEMVFFIKYEYWPNYLNQLKKRNIPTYLISGVFRERQLFFKWYGRFYRKALDTFNHFFVQNTVSKSLLLKLGKTNVTISGDTRFDRVVAILEKNNELDFISAFKDNITTIVIGSSWPKDEVLLVEFINKTTLNVKFIIAPHNIKSEQIGSLKKSITKKVVLFSEKEDKKLANFDVFIIDTIGVLTKIYSYADIAYVGGGFGTSGIHNILEPATFGIPIVIGPNYSHFGEAIALVNIGGCISISTQGELDETFDSLLLNTELRKEKGAICSSFVQENKNATTIILNYITNGNKI